MQDSDSSHLRHRYYYRIIAAIYVQNKMILNIKIADKCTMTQSAQERKHYDPAGGTLTKHDIPFVAIKVVAVVKSHSWTN